MSSSYRSVSKVTGRRLSDTSLIDEVCGTFDGGQGEAECLRLDIVVEDNDDGERSLCIYYSSSQRRHS
jgi:hypothetical protein